MWKRAKKKAFKFVTWGRSATLKFVILIARTQPKGSQQRESQLTTFLVLLDGDMEKSAIPALRKAIAPLFKTRKDAIQLIVDLSKVSRVDSAGIATLLDWLQDSKKEGMQFTLAGLTPEVQALLEMDHLKDAFQVVPPLQWVVQWREYFGPEG